MSDTEIEPTMVRPVLNQVVEACKHSIGAAHEYSFENGAESPVAVLVTESMTNAEGLHVTAEVDLPSGCDKAIHMMSSTIHMSAAFVAFDLASHLFTYRIFKFEDMVHAGTEVLFQDRHEKNILYELKGASMREAIGTIRQQMPLRWTPSRQSRTDVTLDNKDFRNSRSDVSTTGQSMGTPSSGQSVGAPSSRASSTLFSRPSFGPTADLGILLSTPDNTPSFGRTADLGILPTFRDNTTQPRGQDRHGMCPSVQGTVTSTAKKVPPQHFGVRAFQVTSGANTDAESGPSAIEPPLPCVTAFPKTLPITGDVQMFSSTLNTFIDGQVEGVALISFQEKQDVIPAGSVFVNCVCKDHQLSKWILPHMLNATLRTISSKTISVESISDCIRVLPLSGSAKVFSNKLNEFLDCQVEGIALDDHDGIPAGSVFVKNDRLSKWIRPDQLVSTLELVCSHESSSPNTTYIGDREPWILAISGFASVFSQTLNGFVECRVDGVAVENVQEVHHDVDVPAGSVHVNYGPGMQLFKWMRPQYLSSCLLKVISSDDNVFGAQVPWILPLTGNTKIFSQNFNTIVDASLEGIALEDVSDYIPAGSVFVNDGTLQLGKWIAPKDFSSTFQRM